MNEVVIMGKIPTREEAFEIFKKYNKTDSLTKHALAVEGVMRHFAKILNEDEELWGTVGLLHDLDYEKYPDEHCKKVVEILGEYEVDQSFINSIVSHAYKSCSDVEPKHIMEKVLYTIDELTGLINASVLMRPNKSVMDIEYKSVYKKYKQVSFAAGVDRSIIENGLAMIDMELKYVIEQCILGMREVADSIGLAGE